MIEIILEPVLPAREVAIGWLSELLFEVFEPTETGLREIGRAHV